MCVRACLRIRVFKVLECCFSNIILHKRKSPKMLERWWNLRKIRIFMYYWNYLKATDCLTRFRCIFIYFTIFSPFLRTSSILNWILCERREGIHTVWQNAITVILMYPICFVWHLIVTMFARCVCVWDGRAEATHLGCRYKFENCTVKFHKAAAKIRYLYV